MNTTPTALPGAEDALREALASEIERKLQRIHPSNHRSDLPVTIKLNRTLSEFHGLAAALQSPRASDEVRAESVETYMVKRLNEGGLKHVSGSQTMLADEFARYEAERASDEVLGEASVSLVDACASCGFERKEHHYNGACYGLCGKFVPPVPIDAGGAIDCPHCGGVGDIDDGDHPCMKCGGTGKISHTAPVADAQAKEGAK
jgi:sarcosine oxidase delta subunit